MNRPNALPYILILVAGLIWGATFSLTLIATADGTHPLILASAQVVICSFFFVLICLGCKIDVFRLEHLRHYCLLAAVGIAFPNLLYYSVAPHLSAGILSITVSTAPMFTYLMAWVLGYESLRMKRAVGIILGMIAIVLLVLPDHGLKSMDAIFYSIENIYISEGVDDSVDVRELLSGSNIIAMLILVPLTLIQGHSVSLEWVVSQSAWAVLGISISSTFAYMMFFYTIKISEPVFAS